MAVDGAGVAETDVVALGSGGFGLFETGALLEELLEVLGNFGVGHRDDFLGNLDALPIGGLEFGEDIDFVADDDVGALHGFVLLDVGEGVDGEALLFLDAIIALSEEALADFISDILGVLLADHRFGRLARTEAGEGGFAREALEHFLFGGGDGGCWNRHGDGAAGRVGNLDFDVHGCIERRFGSRPSGLARGGRGSKRNIPPRSTAEEGPF